MTKLVVLVSAAFLAAGCGKTSDDSGGGPNKAAEPSPGVPPGPAAPVGAGAGATKWLTIDLLGIEVDAPSCAQVMSQDSSQATVVAGGGGGCTAMALTFNNMGNAPTSYDDQLKILTNGSSPAFSRKDKTADGWVFAYKLAAGGDEPKQHVIAQFKAIQCVGETSVDGEGAAQQHTCASMRAKK
ncbi:MAG TPA: hypothetical protein VGF94_28040 [Kofleriaceae bacterium]|jgi:hypothetical protein